MMKCYVINLDRSTDRLAHVSEVFHKVGLSFIRVPAVDGRTLSQEELSQLTAVSNWNKKLTASEVGCFLSHRECLRLIAEGDDPYGAIFEDDILLSPNAGLFLKDWNWIPENADIVKIDTAKIRCLLGKEQVKLQKNYFLSRLINKHYCAGGYIVSKQCAKHLYALTAEVSAPIDELYFNPACGLLQTMNVEQMVPAIVVQAGLVSTIRSDNEPDKPRKRSKLSLWKKIQREYQRAEIKHFYPLRMKFFKGCRLGVVPFE